MSPEIVLIVSDQPGSGPAQALVELWQQQAEPPLFAQVRAELWNGGAPPAFTLAVVTGMGEARLAHALSVLIATGKPVICVSEDCSPALRKMCPGVVFLPQGDSWTEVVIQFAGEVFGRVAAGARASRFEQSAAAAATQAALGRFILEVRHNFNNALTSVLGNSELLMLDVDALQPRTREQVEAIHSMALRMHQVMQRFTSLETELRVAEKPSQNETEAPRQAAAASA